MNSRTKQAEDERAVLSEMAALVLRSLDAKREAAHRRLKGRLTENEVGWAVSRLFHKDLIRLHEKRSLGEVVYTLTDEGWAMSGHDKPFWLEAA